MRAIIFVRNIMTVFTLGVWIAVGALSLPGDQSVSQKPTVWRAYAAAARQTSDTPAAHHRVPDSIAKVPPPSGDPLPSPFVDTAQRVLPAVVSVEGTRFVDHPTTDGDQDFFRRLFPRRDDGREGFEVPTRGSGFIVDAQGYVLTNDHVVGAADELHVYLMDGTKLPARLLGTDPETDVAVLKLDLSGYREPLPTLTLGNSDEMRVGDWTIAIGNSLGELDGTLTVGVVSAKGRNNLRIAGGGPTYQDFLQTDASINFGNSGGPLVNVRGEVIGINSAVNPTGQGLGFAIPINMAREVSVELIQRGSVSRGYLGILPEPLDEDLRGTPELGDRGGILVAQVERDTPADDGGLEAGDIILVFNHRGVKDVPEFRDVVAESGAGETVPIVILRDGVEKHFAITLGERPPRRDLEVPWDPPPPEDFLGATVEPITPELMETFGILGGSGLVVTRITPGRPAAGAGLQTGDLIESVNGKYVNELELFREALMGSVDQEEVEIQVRRGSGDLTIRIPWES